MTGCLNYPAWRNEHKGILKDLKDKRVLITYSGGKDSSIMLHFLQQASDEFGFNFETHAVPFPTHVLTDTEIKRLDQYWQKRGLSIIWHPVGVSDDALLDALNQHIIPCTVCNQTKKEILLKFFRENTMALDQLVIVVNYSLWDIVSATVEHIVGGLYKDPASSNMLKGKNPEERFIETSQRFYPMLTINRGLSVFKPLIKYNDQDIEAAVQENQIPVTRPMCRFHEHRPKRWFAKYYHAMNMRFDYDSVLAFAKESLHLPDISYFEKIDLKNYLSSVF
jgi:tRNA(Ile)-lysidine synthase TilS/MesJ